MEKFSDTPPLFATADVDLFKSLYEEVSESVVTTSKCPTPAMSSERDFTIKVLERNVLHGSSHFCGLLAYACYEYFAEEPLTKESCRMAMLAGWCSELVKIFYINIRLYNFTVEKPFCKIMNTLQLIKFTNPETTLFLSWKHLTVQRRIL